MIILFILGALVAGGIGYILGLPAKKEFCCMRCVSCDLNNCVFSGCLCHSFIKRNSSDNSLKLFIYKVLEQEKYKGREEGYAKALADTKRIILNKIVAGQNKSKSSNEKMWAIQNRTEYEEKEAEFLRACGNSWENIDWFQTKCREIEKHKPKND